MVLEVSARVLEKLHYAVLKAENGRDAVALFSRYIDQVVLVILDMNMPGMSGGVVFEELRKLKPDVKVLLTSGYGLDGRTQELIASGDCGFLQKLTEILLQ
jgi:CheY-like chemotaxis protein